VSSGVSKPPTPLLLPFKGEGGSNRRSGYPSRKSGFHIGHVLVYVRMYSNMSLGVPIGELMDTLIDEKMQPGTVLSINKKMQRDAFY
jgi:hypothetical protein